MNRLRILCLLMFLPMMAGCWTAVVAGGAIGVNYTITNVAYQTLNAPIGSVSKAVEKAFKNMGIAFVSNSKTEEGREIKGATKGLNIIVELESITDKTTKISVDAQENAVVKDKATAAEIIAQTEKAL